MKINKEAKSLNMRWEGEYGYSQAVKVRDTIYLAGQVSHDDEGNILGEGDMEVQMRAAYVNIGKVLEQYGATIDNVVDEILFATDTDAAFAARVKMKQEVFSGSPVLGSTIVQIQRQKPRPRQVKHHAVVSEVLTKSLLDGLSGPTTFKLKDVRANPFRNIEHYPIHPEKIEALRASINSTGFWDILPATNGFERPV